MLNVRPVPRNDLVRSPIKITNEEDMTRIRVYARKMFLSRKELAAGILYQIAERIEEGDL